MGDVSKPSESTGEKVLDAVLKGFRTYEQWESKVLTEIGFSGPTAQGIVRSGEIVGGTVLGIGALAASVAGVDAPVTIPVASAGYALAFDGIAGYDYMASDPGKPPAAKK